MKALIISFIICIALAGYGYYAYIPVTTGTPQKVSALIDAPITISSLQPKVEVSKLPEHLFEIIAGPMKTQDAEVKTDSSGRASITAPSPYKTLLDYNSQTSVTYSDADKRTTLTLSKGAMWVHPTNATTSNENFVVTTSLASITPRNASVGIWHSTHNTTIVITEGSIALSRSSVPDVSSIELVAGNTAIINADGDMSVSSTTSDEKSSAWFLYNQ